MHLYGHLLCEHREVPREHGLAQQLRCILSDLEWGDLAVSARLEKFEPLMRRFEHLANRFVLGILAATFITRPGSAAGDLPPPGIEQWAGVLFAIGFVAARR